MTTDEETFLARMIPYMVLGRNMEDAGRAVLADDERLWLAATERSDVGETIRTELAERVYNSIRKFA